MQFDNTAAAPTIGEQLEKEYRDNVDAVAEQIRSLANQIHHKAITHRRICVQDLNCDRVIVEAHFSRTFYRVLDLIDYRIQDTIEDFSTTYVVCPSAEYTHKPRPKYKHLPFKTDSIGWTVLMTFVALPALVALGVIAITNVF